MPCLTLTFTKPHLNIGFDRDRCAARKPAGSSDPGGSVATDRRRDVELGGDLAEQVTADLAGP